jgi:hypothetical protein
MHLENIQPTTARQDPRAFVMTLSLVIIALTCLAVITTQI